MADRRSVGRRNRRSEVGLVNIVGFEIDPSSSHGPANRRLIALYDDWVRGHAGDVNEFDHQKVAATQLDKLTDEQIRLIAREAEPEGKPASRQ